MPRADRLHPRLLALRPLGLGDLLAAVPALRGLARAFPDHERILACPRALTPLALATGAIERVADTQPLRRLDPALDGTEVAVDLHGKGPASQRVLLASHPARLIAFEHMDVPQSRGMPVWRADEHEVHRWCRMLAEHGIPSDPTDLYLEEPPASVPINGVGPTIVHAGAAYPARRWPAERFAQVARVELEAGRRVLFTGTRSERGLAARVARLAGGGSVVAGETDLASLAALVRVAARVITGDTGVAHLATALRTPSVVLFGPVSPAQWGPPPGKRHRVLWAGYVGDPHGSKPDVGLLAIHVEDVLGALAALDEVEAAA